MAARVSKSKKGSAANSAPAPQPDEQHTFFLDKCLGRFDVAKALKEVGAAVELHTDHFDQDAADHDWLPRVGERGWVILTKDRHLLTNQLEIAALLRANTHSFVLRAADMSGEEMARAFQTAYPTMIKFIQKFTPPCLSQITRAGKVSMLVQYDGLVKRLD